MSKVTLDAATHYFAVPHDGTTTPLDVDVSVADEGGKPVSGLPKSVFDVTNLYENLDEESSEPLSPTVQLLFASEWPQGFYKLSVGPGSGLAWAKGIYVLALTVETTQPQRGPAISDYHGQALVKFAIN